MLVFFLVLASGPAAESTVHCEIIEFNAVGAGGAWWAPPEYILFRREDGEIHDWTMKGDMIGKPWRTGKWNWKIMVHDKRYGRKGFYIIEARYIYESETPWDPEVEERAAFPMDRRVPLW